MIVSLPGETRRHREERSTNQLSAPNPQQTSLHDFYTANATEINPNPYQARAQAYQQSTSHTELPQQTFHSITPESHENIEYGDSIHQKLPDHFRQYGGNVNGISPSDQFSMATDIGLQASSDQAVGLSLIETNVNFQFHGAHHIIRRQLAPAWENKVNNYYQPGGMCQLFGSTWVHRIVEAASDESGLGQWAYHTLQGAHGRRLTIITVYQVCAGNNGEKTTWAQRQSILTVLTDDMETPPDPRKHFCSELIKICNQFQRNKNGLLLFIDANSDLLDINSWLQRFIVKHNSATPSLFDTDVR